jgi:hypothetical protein
LAIVAVSVDRRLSEIDVRPRIRRSLSRSIDRAWFKCVAMYCTFWTRVSRAAWLGDSLETLSLLRIWTLASSAEMSETIRAFWAISCTRRSRSSAAVWSESMRACSCGEGLLQARAPSNRRADPAMARFVAFMTKSPFPAGALRDKPNRRRCPTVADLRIPPDATTLTDS